MESRRKILYAVKENQPAKCDIPDLSALSSIFEDPISQFEESIKAIGGNLIRLNNKTELRDYIKNVIDHSKRSLSTTDMLINVVDSLSDKKLNPKSLHDIEFLFIEATIGVAENGAIWVTEKNIQHRVLPFITQHLFSILYSRNIVPDMHAAYKFIGKTEYSYSTFIAGPSKTADIEQSLVIGAHGARSHTILLIQD